MAKVIVLTGGRNAGIMQVNDPRTTPFLFLTQLPKSRRVLDFVLNKIGREAGPERHELLEHIFNLHLESAGFDPFALARGRFKRMRAAEFRQQLLSVDSEVALIMTTEEYRQVTAYENLIPEQFEQYTRASLRLNADETDVIEKFESFAAGLIAQDAYELLCAFTRQHLLRFQSLLNENELEQLLANLNDYERAAARLQNLSRLFITLKLQEYKSVKGIRDEDVQLNLVAALENEFREEENVFRKEEILHALLRAAMLCKPASEIAPLVELAVGSFKFQSSSVQWNEHAEFLLLKAEYLPYTELSQRNEWLDQAELLAKSNNDFLIRSCGRYLRSWIAADAGEYSRALRYIDESEHLIHRIPERSLAARNKWISICLSRIIVYVMQVLGNDDEFHSEFFDAQVQLVQESGRHRSDVQVYVLIMTGLKLFLSQNWTRADETFHKARLYYPVNSNHSLALLVNAFCCIPAKTRGDFNPVLLKLESAQNMFYSYTVPAMLKLSMQFYLRSTETV